MTLIKNQISPENLISNVTAFNTTGKFPTSLLIAIFKYNVMQMPEPLELLSLRRVCKHWDGILSRDWFWELLFQKKYTHTYLFNPQANQTLTYKERYIAQLQVDKNIINDKCAVTSFSLLCDVSCKFDHIVFSSPFDVFDLSSSIFELLVYKDQLVAVTCSGISFLDSSSFNLNKKIDLNLSESGLFVSSYHWGNFFSFLFENQAFVTDLELREVKWKYHHAQKNEKELLKGILVNQENVFLLYASREGLSLATFSFACEKPITIFQLGRPWEKQTIMVQVGTLLEPYRLPMPMSFNTQRMICIAVSAVEVFIDILNNQILDPEPVNGYILSRICWKNDYIVYGTNSKTSVQIYDRNARKMLPRTQQSHGRASSIKKFDNKLMYVMTIGEGQYIQLEMCLGSMSKNFLSVTKEFLPPWPRNNKRVVSSISPVTFGNGKLFLTKDKKIICYDYQVKESVATCFQGTHKRKRSQDK